MAPSSPIRCSRWSAPPRRVGLVKLPAADRALVDPAKARDYLLSPAHPVGRYKAYVFFSLGYTQVR